jgi:hypothetical protein
VTFDLPGPAGRLDALVEDPPAGAPAFAAIVCHPHPRFGGTMHTHAVHRIARAVRTAGGTSLRFNYRGVGRSWGAYDRGRGEADDARAALDWLRRERAGVPLLACGFSFGAWMATAAAGDAPDVKGLLLAGVAITSVDPDLPRDLAFVRAVEKPVAVVQAGDDALGPPGAVEAGVAGSRGPRRFTLVPGATHLFTEDLSALEREAGLALAWLLAGGGAG